MSRTVAQIQTVACPECQAEPGRPCVDTSTGFRRDAVWVHIVREAAWLKAQRLKAQQ